MPLRRSALVHAALAAFVFLAAEGRAAAAAPYLVKNVVTGASSSISTSATSLWTASLGNKLLYAAQSPSGGFLRLFVSDGTSAGTFELANVIPGSVNATGENAKALAPAPTLGGVTYFYATPSSMPGMYRTDGTTLGTTRAALTPSSFRYATIWNGKMLLADAAGSLWVSDGTTAGSTRIKVFNGTTGILSLSDTRALSVSTEGLGYQVYVTDGTTSSLIPGSPFNAEFTGGSDAVIGAEALFIGTGGLWKTDGVTVSLVSATVLTADEFTRLGSSTYFIGNSKALWKTDGTSAGTTLVMSFPTNPRQLVSMGGALYFLRDGELWKSDGTAAGTVSVASVPSIANLTAFAGGLYFLSTNTATGTELWSSDGTAAGTAIVADIRPGSASSNPGMFRVVGDKFFFAADDGANGRELWALDAPPPSSDAGVDSGSSDAAIDSSITDSSITDSAGADSATVDSAIVDSTIVDSAIADSTVADSIGDSSVDSEPTADSAIAEDSATADAAEDTTVVADSSSPADTNPIEDAAEPAAAATDDSAGCGCATPGTTSSSPSLLLVAALLALARRRR